MCVCMCVSACLQVFNVVLKDTWRKLSGKKTHTHTHIVRINIKYVATFTRITKYINVCILYTSVNVAVVVAAAASTLLQD